MLLCCSVARTATAMLVVAMKAHVMLLLLPLLVLAHTYMPTRLFLPSDLQYWLIHTQYWLMHTLQEIANDILSEQSPKRLYAVRGKLYELLGNCVPPELIIRVLLLELLRKLDDELKAEATSLAAFYEHRMQEGQKPIFHLEAFVAKFMAAYKQWAITNLG